MSEPTAADGYRGARFLRDTPYSTITEWRRAMIDAIPDDEKCPACSGSGADVILASNGGVGEVVNCWPCEGTGRRRKGASDV
jgi:hypothetical protein